MSRRRFQPDLDHLAARTAEIQAELASQAPLVDRPTAADRIKKSLRAKIKYNSLRRARFVLQQEAISRGHSNGHRAG
jgi:hypothetical protein